MKIVVDVDVCESNGVCTGIAPDVFELRSDDYLYVLIEEPPEERRADMERAVRGCPLNAISIDD